MKPRALVIVTIFAVLACGEKSSPKGSAASKGSAQTPGAKVHLAVTVDWEGAYVDSEGLDSLDKFRAAFPGAPLTHFLSAGYFTRPSAKPDWAKTIHLAVEDIDEVGLHIHCWTSLVKAAGVAPRLQPSYLKAEAKPFEDGDGGFEVELDGYTAEEIRAIVRKSKELLVASGVTLSSSFRASGGLATAKVLAAVRTEGFSIDSSAASSEDAERELGDSRLGKRIKEVWPDITEFAAQPFTIKTDAGAVIEMPQSMGYADYADADRLEKRLRWAVAEIRKNPQREIFMNVGFHQETGHEFVDRIIKAIQAVQKDSGDLLVFETVSTSAEIAKQGL